MKATVFASLLLMWAAASPAQAAQSAMPAAVSAHESWVREVPPVSPAAALFMRLHNAGAQTVSIRSISTPAAKRVEWHDMVMSNGHMRMTQRIGVELPPGETVLKPGGSHLMLIGLAKPLRVGDVVPVSVLLANGQTLTLAAPVRASKPHAISTKAALPHAH